MNIFESLSNKFFKTTQQDTLSINDPTKIQTDFTSDLDLSQLIIPAMLPQSIRQQDLTNAQLIMKYRQLACAPEASVMVDEVVNEFYSGTTNEVPKLKIENEDLPENLNKKINESFSKILNLMNFRYYGKKIIKKWYVDGHLFLECIYDNDKPKNGIQYIGVLDPIGMSKEYDEATKSYIYKYTAGNQTYFGSSIDNYSYKQEQIVYVNSGEVDPNGKIISHLHPAVKVNNQMEVIEDMIVVYRITRGTDKRSIKVNVGNMPKTKAVTYMTELVNKFRYKKSYNRIDGTVENNAHIMAVTEDIWLPTKNSTKDIEIDTLQGGQNLGELDDLHYFRNKLLLALRVPANRFNNDMDSFDISATEINRQELRFAQFVSTLRLKFNEVFIELLKRELIITNVMNEAEFNKYKKDIIIYYPGESVLAKKQFNAELKNRLELLEQMEQYIGKYYSDEYVKKHILDQTDEEIEEMRSQMDSELLSSNSGDSNKFTLDTSDDTETDDTQTDVQNNKK